MSFRPLLASNCDDIEQVKFPVLVSPKLDGIRCVIRYGQPLTRSLKPIPNHHIRAALHGLPSFDGELIVGNPKLPNTWNTTSSAVMSFGGEPDFTFYVFDLIGDGRFHDRLIGATKAVAECDVPNIRILHHKIVANPTELIAAEAEAVSMGYEGLMLRSVDGVYKYGRSTTKEGILLKMKRFDDLEARICGVAEKLTHVGEAKVNALGLLERGHRKDDMVPAGTLGALQCVIDASSGTERIEFEVGTGFTDADRAELWARTDLVGKLAKIKHQGLTPEGRPRFPVFLGLRDEADLEFMP